MPVIDKTQGVDISRIQQQLADPNKGYEDRAPYREAISTLRSGEVLKIKPDPDPEAKESERAVQFRISLAAKEVGIAVRYGKGKDGDILVWLDEDNAEATTEDGSPLGGANLRKNRKPRAPKKASESSANGATPASAMASEEELVPA